MINGFIVEVKNENEEDRLLSLFSKNKIPAGLIIRSINSNYKYDTLLLMALNEGYIGSGISTDNNRINQVTIYKNNEPTSIEFHKVLDRREIIIDGDANFIEITIPAASTILVQLIPALGNEIKY